MLDPDRMIKLTLFHQDGNKTILEIDPELILGWTFQPPTTEIIIDGPENFNKFRIKEKPEEIKALLRQLAN